MKLKEDLISKLKIGQFSPIIFGEVSMDVWDRKIEAREDFDLFFNSELLKYEQEYFQINSPPLAFIIKNFNSISFRL